VGCSEGIGKIRQGRFLGPSIFTQPFLPDQGNPVGSLQQREPGYQLWSCHCWSGRKPSFVHQIADLFLLLLVPVPVIFRKKMPLDGIDPAGSFCSSRKAISRLDDIAPVVCSDVKQPVRIPMAGFGEYKHAAGILGIPSFLAISKFPAWKLVSLSWRWFMLKSIGHFASGQSNVVFLKRNCNGWFKMCDNTFVEVENYNSAYHWETFGRVGGRTSGQYLTPFLSPFSNTRNNPPRSRMFLRSGSHP